MEYAGDSSGTLWQWTSVTYTPPILSTDGYTYSWNVQDFRVPDASTDVQINGDDFGPATYLTAGNPDHRNGITPEDISAAVAAVQIITAYFTGGAAPTGAFVTLGEISLSNVLTPTDYNTVKTRSDTKIT